MTLYSYLNNNVLIGNTYEIFDYSTLRGRLLTRYAQQRIRNDIPDDLLSEYAQNVVDVNKDYLSAIFETVVTPNNTYGEHYTSQDSSSDDRKTVTVSGDSGNSNTVNTPDTTSTTISNSNDTTSVNAYNSTTMSPNTSNTGNATSTITTSGTIKTDTTNAAQHNSTVNDGNTSKHNTTYTRSGYNATDYFAVMQGYKSPYDILVDMLASVILSTISPIDLSLM